MVLTVKMALIVAVGVFLASFMDAIAGGGGIISVPTYLLAGVPMHMALGTNKVSSGIGTAVSTARFIKNGYIDWKLGIPSVALALVGSFVGTSIQLMIDEVYLQYLLLIVLVLVLTTVCGYFLLERAVPCSLPKLAVLMTGGLGILYLFVLPPLTAPDEISHYVSAYRLSSQMTGQPQRDRYGRVLLRAQDAWIEDLNGDFVYEPDEDGNLQRSWAKRWRSPPTSCFTAWA